MTRVDVNLLEECLLCILIHWRIDTKVAGHSLLADDFAAYSLHHLVRRLVHQTLLIEKALHFLLHLLTVMLLSQLKGVHVGKAWFLDKDTPGLLFRGTKIFKLLDVLTFEAFFALLLLSEISKANISSRIWRGKSFRQNFVGFGYFDEIDICITMGDRVATRCLFRASNLRLWATYRRFAGLWKIRVASQPFFVC